MLTISETKLKELLEQEKCSSDFIEDALRYKSYFDGDIETFIDKVEEVLYAIENSDEDEDFNDEDFDEEEYDEDLFDDYFTEDESEEEEDDDQEDTYK
jgi:hypothetical protein